MLPSVTGLALLVMILRMSYIFDWFVSGEIRGSIKGGSFERER